MAGQSVKQRIPAFYLRLIQDFDDLEYQSEVDNLYDLGVMVIKGVDVGKRVAPVDNEAAKSDPYNCATTQMVIVIMLAYEVD